MCFKLLVRVLNPTILRIKPRTVRFNSSSFYLPNSQQSVPRQAHPLLRRGLGEAAPFCCAWALFLSLSYYLSHFLQLSSPGVDDESAHSDILWDERMLANGIHCASNTAWCVVETVKIFVQIDVLFGFTISSSLIPRSRISCRKWLACMSHAPHPEW